MSAAEMPVAFVHEVLPYGVEVIPLFGVNGETAFQDNDGMISPVNIERAVTLIDRAEIVGQIEAWQNEDRLTNANMRAYGGRKSSIAIRTILILFMVLAQDHKGVLITNMAKLVANRMTPENRVMVGLAANDACLEGLYTRLWRVANAWVSVFDPYPSNRQGRMAYEEHLELKAKQSVDPRTEVIHRRLDWFANSLLEASANTLPAKYRTWQGNVALDATLIRTHGQLGTSAANQITGFDRDGAYYSRQGDHSVGTESGGSDMHAYGYEATFAVQIPNAPGKVGEFPALAIRMAFHKPGTGISDEARRVMQSIFDGGYPIGLFIADRAYAPHADAKKLQIPLKAMGYGIVADLKDQDLGTKDGFGGAQIVEGRWYCPSMPKVLVDATITYRATRKDPTLDAEMRATARALYYTRIEARLKYELRRKESSIEPGESTPMMCPAMGAGATVDCPLRARLSKKPLISIAKKDLSPEELRGAICTNKSSVHFPFEAGAKWIQSIPFASESHARTYAMRVSVEGFNGFTKDANHESIGEPLRRQLRGYGAQYLLTSMLVTASNLRKVRGFLNRKQDEERREGLGLTPLAPRRKGAGQYALFAKEREKNLLKR